MTNKEIKTALTTAGTEFTVRGGDMEFQINRYSDYLESDNAASGLSVGPAKGICLNGMNMAKIGTKRVSFYTYNLFGGKSTQVIKLADITITKVGEETETETTK